MDNTEILVAAMSDPEFKVRLQQLREEQAALKAQHEELLADIDRRGELVREANLANTAASEKLALVTAKEQALEEDTIRLAEANRALAEEKDRWEKHVREPVRQQHEAKDGELTEREARVEEREKIVEKREMDVIAEGEALAAAQRKHEVAADHFARGLQALNAPAD
jgi:hypothetical protein